VSRQQAERRGRTAEWAAMIFLMCKGYRILAIVCARNYGEVDISGLERRRSRHRRSQSARTYDAGAYAVTPMAQQRIARAAQTLSGPLAAYRPRQSALIW
jgi:putative endonuclease